MKALELYINSKAGGQHNFIVVDGNRRTAPTQDFRSDSIHEMMAEAERLLTGDADFEQRMRVYDHGRMIFKGGDGTHFVTAKQLQLWTSPEKCREPQPNEHILGRALA